MNEVSFTYQTLTTDDFLGGFIPIMVAALSIILGCFGGMAVITCAERVITKILGGLIVIAGIAGVILSIVFSHDLSGQDENRPSTGDSLKTSIEQTMNATYVSDPEDLARHLSGRPQPIVLKIDGTPTNCTFTLTSQQDADEKTGQGQATGTVACTGVAVITK